MADFLVTLKIKLETAAGTATPGTAGAAPTPTTTASATDVSKEFSDLSVQLRAAVDTFKQIAASLSDLKDNLTGTKRPLSNEEKGGLHASPKPPRDVPKREEESAKASEKKAEADEKSAKAAQESAKAGNDANDAWQKAADAAKQAAEAAQDTIAANKTVRVNQGEFNINDLLQNVIKDVADNPLLKRQAELTSSKLSSFIEVDPFAGSELTELKAKIERNIQRVSEAITGDPVAAPINRSVNRLINSIGASVKDLEGIGTPLEKFGVNIREIERTLRSRGFLALFDAAEKAAARAEKFSSAAPGTVPEKDVRSAQFEAKDTFAALREFISSELSRGPRSIFNVQGPRNQPVGDIAGEIRQFIPAGPQRAELTQVQRNARNILTDESVLDPLKRVQAAFKSLATEGKFDELEQNIRLIRDSLKSFVGSTSEANQVLRETEKLFNFRRNAAGNVQLPGAVDRPTSFANTNSFIQSARQSLSGAPTGAELNFRLPIVDQSGNIRKIDVSLKQLGQTLDSVRVKAQDVSNNMFNRTSVVEALRRVATWGAAAGIVFGAVDAFRNALRVVVDTETGVVALAKVMNESAKDFDGFTKKARQSAVAIAQEFGQPLQDVIQTMIQFGQQGLEFPQVKELTRASALAAVSTDLTQPEAAEALTASLAQFNKEALTATRIIDSFNKVANENAVTEKDLAEAVKRAGLAAQTAGVDFDTFNGIVTTIVKSTRQTGAEVGTALRFIFTRLLTPDAEKGFAKIGISTRTTAGAFRGFTPILKDLSDQWDNLSDTQKANIAIAAAGTRRYNTFLALISDFANAQKVAGDSANSLGSALKEADRVAATTAFKIQQLKNSLVETALSIGDTMSPAIKGLLNLLKGLVDGFNTLPSVLQTSAAATGILVVAFARLGDRTTQLLDLIGGTKSAIGAIGSSVKGGLFQGTPLDVQQQTFSPAKNVQLAQTGSALALTVPDFIRGGKGAEGVKTFTQVLKENNKVLIDNRGRIVDATRDVGKFSAVARGFKVGELDKAGNIISTTALGFSALNSGFSKLAGFFVRISENILRFAQVGRVFDLIEGSVAATNTKLGQFLLGISKVALVAGAIIGLVLGYKALKTAINETGADVKKNLDAEIAKRQEVLNVLEKQKNVSASLRQQRIGAELRPIRDEALQTEEISRGTFKSPFLQESRLNKQANRAANEIGLANPSLIKSIDELGNVSLSSSAGFDRLAESAVSAQKSLLALSHTKVIQAFVDDLKPASGFLKKDLPDALRSAEGTFEGLINAFLPKSSEIDLSTFDELGKTVKDKLNDSRKELENFLKKPIVGTARTLGIDVRLLDEAAGKRISQLTSQFAIAAQAFREAAASIESQIANAPTNAPESLFQSVFSQQNAEAIRQIELIQQQDTGKPVAEGAFAGQQFLKNRAAIRPVSSLIGLSPEETVGKFNENKILQQVETGRDNIKRALENAQGSQLVLFNDIEGIPRQAILSTTEAGRQQIEFFSQQAGQVIKKSVDDIANSVDSITLINTDKVVEEFKQSLFEINRQTTGALRGGILSADLELGPKFKSEGTGQQRAALRDEVFTKNLISAFQELKNAQEDFGTDKQRTEEAPREFASPEVVQNIRKLALEFDKLSTIFRFRVELEELNKTIEESARQLEESSLADGIRKQFSGLFGDQGLQKRFTTLTLPSERNPEERFNQNNQDVVATLNAFSDLQKSLVDTAIAAAKARRNISEVGDDFFSSLSPGGVNDPSRITSLTANAQSLASKGIDEASSIQNALLKEQLDLHSREVAILQQILDQTKGTEGLTAPQAVAASRQINQSTPSSILDKFTSRLERSDLTSFSPQDLREIITSLPEQRRSPELLGAFQQASAREAAPILAQEILSALNTVNRKNTPGASASATQATTLDIAPNNIASIVSDLIEKLGVEVVQPGGRSATQIPDEVITSAARAVGGALAGSTEKAQREQGQQILKLVDQQNKILTSSVRSVLEGARTIVVPAPKEEASKATSPDVRAGKVATEAVAASQQTVSTQLAKFADALAKTTALVDVFGRKLDEAFGEVKSGFAKAVAGLQVLQATRPFTTPTVGALAGISVPSTDLGKTRSELTGTELTALENPRLANGLQDLESVAQSLIGTLQQVEQLRAEASLRRNEAIQSGDAEQIRQASIALAGVGDASSLVQDQLSKVRVSLTGVKEAFRDLNSINELRVNVERLLDGFKKAEFQIKTNTTSIDTALGKTPFSFTRPTFNQFQAGQPGDLNQFQRAMADLNEEFRTGAITASEFSTKRKEVQFNRDESLISFAQERENKVFENRVSTAQQLQGQLFDFVQKGGPGADQAKNLLQQITSEIESAGQLTKIQGSRSITNPITGQRENIPAGQLLQFKGIPSLDKFDQQVAKLAEQFRAQDIEERAKAVSEPIVDALNNGSIAKKLEEINNVLKDNSDAASKAGGISSEDTVQALSKFQENLAGALSSLRGGKVEEENAGSIVALTQQLASLPKELRENLSSIQLDNGKSVIEALKGLDTSNAPAAATAIEQLTSSFRDTVVAPLDAIIKAFDKSVGVFSGAFASFGSQKAIEQTPKFATGGMIRGPGGPRQDRVPILASPGEFIINAASAAKIGISALESLNSVGGKVSNQNNGGRFRDGGLVPVEVYRDKTGFLSVYKRKEDVDRENREKELEKRRDEREKQSEQRANVRQRAAGKLVYYDNNSNRVVQIAEEQKQEFFDPEFPGLPLPNILGFATLEEALLVSENLEPYAIRSLVEKKNASKGREYKRLRDQQLNKKDKKDDLAKKAGLANFSDDVKNKLEAEKQFRIGLGTGTASALQLGGKTGSALKQGQLFAAYNKETGELAFSSNFTDFLDPNDPDIPRTGYSSYVDASELKDEALTLQNIKRLTDAKDSKISKNRTDKQKEALERALGLQQAAAQQDELSAQIPEQVRFLAIQNAREIFGNSADALVNLQSLGEKFSSEKGRAQIFDESSSVKDTVAEIQDSFSKLKAYLGDVKPFAPLIEVPNAQTGRTKNIKANFALFDPILGQDVEDGKVISPKDVPVRKFLYAGPGEGSLLPLAQNIMSGQLEAQIKAIEGFVNKSNKAERDVFVANELIKGGDVFANKSGRIALAGGLLAGTIGKAPELGEGISGLIGKTAKGTAGIFTGDTGITDIGRGIKGAGVGIAKGVVSAPIDLITGTGQAITGAIEGDSAKIARGTAKGAGGATDILLTLAGGAGAGANLKALRATTVSEFLASKAATVTGAGLRLGELALPARTAASLQTRVGQFGARAAQRFGTSGRGFENIAFRGQKISAGLEAQALQEAAIKDFIQEASGIRTGVGSSIDTAKSFRKNFRTQSSDLLDDVLGTNIPGFKPQTVVPKFTTAADFARKATKTAAPIGLGATLKGFKSGILGGAAITAGGVLAQALTGLPLAGAGALGGVANFIRKAAPGAGQTALALGQRALPLPFKGLAATTRAVGAAASVIGKAPAAIKSAAGTLGNILPGGRVRSALQALEKLSPAARESIFKKLGINTPGIRTSNEGFVSGSITSRQPAIGTEVPGFRFDEGTADDIIRELRFRGQGLGPSSIEDLINRPPTTNLSAFDALNPPTVAQFSQQLGPAQKLAGQLSSPLRNIGRIPLDAPNFDQLRSIGAFNRAGRSVRDPNQLIDVARLNIEGGLRPLANLPVSDLAKQISSGRAGQLDLPTVSQATEAAKLAQQLSSPLKNVGRIPGQVPNFNQLRTIEAFKRAGRSVRTPGQIPDVSRLLLDQPLQSFPRQSIADLAKKFNQGQAAPFKGVPNQALIPAPQLSPALTGAASSAQVLTQANRALLSSPSDLAKLEEAIASTAAPRFPGARPATGLEDISGPEFANLQRELTSGAFNALPAQDIKGLLGPAPAIKLGPSSAPGAPIPLGRGAERRLRPRTEAVQLLDINDFPELAGAFDTAAAKISATPKSPLANLRGILDEAKIIAKRTAAEKRFEADLAAQTDQVIRDISRGGEAAVSRRQGPLTPKEVEDLTAAFETNILGENPGFLKNPTFNFLKPDNILDLEEIVKKGLPQKDIDALRNQIAKRRALLHTRPLSEAEARLELTKKGIFHPEALSLPKKVSPVGIAQQLEDISSALPATPPNATANLKAPKNRRIEEFAPGLTASQGRPVISSAISEVREKLLAGAETGSTRELAANDSLLRAQKALEDRGMALENAGAVQGPQVKFDINEIPAENIDKFAKILDVSSEDLKTTFSSVIPRKDILQKIIDNGIDPDLLSELKNMIERRKSLRSPGALEKISNEIRELERARNVNKFATGGMIQGPGGPKTDNIPILASPGEFILNAASTAKIGRPILEAMNKNGKVPRFRDGGLVGLDTTDLLDQILEQVRNTLTSADIFKPIKEQAEKVSSDIRTSSDIPNFSGTISADEQRKFSGVAQLSDKERLQRKVDLLEGAQVGTSQGTSSSPERTFDFSLPSSNRSSLQGSLDLVEGTSGSLSEDAVLQAAFKRNVERSKNRISVISSKQLDIIEEEKKKLGLFASGGKIEGPGGPKSDRVPIFASPGEFILNAEAANKIGLPLLESMNKTGSLPAGFVPKRFAEGGLVGGGQSISIDADAIGQKIAAAITQAISSQQVEVDVDSIASAIRDAFANIELPTIKVDTQDLPTLKVEAPDSIPLDTSSLQGTNLGGALGADVVNRLEAIEGSTTALRQDVNQVLDKVDNIADIDFNGAIEDIGGLKEQVATINSDVGKIRLDLSDQEVKLEDKVFFMINEQLSTANFTGEANTKFERFRVDVQEQITRISSEVNSAIATANQAMSQALSR